MQLEGQIALITGAGSGIGRALAVEASQRGVNLVLAGRRMEALQETCSLLSPGVACMSVAGDITDRRVRNQIREAVARKWGRLNILVNNAGSVLAGPLAAAEEDEIERMMAINVLAPAALTATMLPLLRAALPARVVNVGSMFGDIAFPLFAAYSTSKFALRGLSNALRRELRPLDIGVTYAAPRAVRTDAARATARYSEPFGMPMDEPATVARLIWKGIAQGRDSIYPPRAERIFVLLERLFPALVTRALASQLARNGLWKVIDEATPPAPPALPFVAPAPPFLDGKADILAS